MDLQFSTECMEKISQLVREELRRLLPPSAVESIADLEEGLRRSLQQVGAMCLQQALGLYEATYPEAERPCPGCGLVADYQRRRAATTLTVFGSVRYKRAYYLCPHCHRGHCPLDERLGLEPGGISAGLGPLLALLGIQTSFAESSDKLAEELLLVKVSDNTIRKETQQMGRFQEVIEQAQQQTCAEVNLHQVRAQATQRGPLRLYGSVDGTIVPVGEEWRELKAGSWYVVEASQAATGEEAVGQPAAGRARDITYYCDIASAQDFAGAVWASGYQRLAHLAEEVVFLADGAAWIWNLVAANFPQATQIVDWYHAVAYLPPIAQAAFPDGPQRQRWLEQARQWLWEGQLDALLAACEQLLDCPQAANPAATAMTYYHHNRQRLDYARFRAEGYQIGSGPMESGCKQIAALRLKRAGARWTEAGARYTAKARAAWLSGQWDTLKQSRRRLSDLPLAV